MSFTQDELQTLNAIFDQKIAELVNVLEQVFDQRLQNLRKDFEQQQKQLVDLEAIEVQTEIPWEDLINLLNNALNEQFIAFNTSLQARLRSLEHEVTAHLQLLHNELHKEQPIPSNMESTEVGMQGILASINQLERVVESMQVAMSANSTLLSQRLYHHQRLSVERAHPSHSPSANKHQQPLTSEGGLAPASPEETDA